MVRIGRKVTAVIGKRRGLGASLARMLLWVPFKVFAVSVRLPSIQLATTKHLMACSRDGQMDDVQALEEFMRQFVDEQIALVMPE